MRATPGPSLLTPNRTVGYRVQLTNQFEVCASTTNMGEPVHPGHALVYITAQQNIKTAVVGQHRCCTAELFLANDPIMLITPITASKSLSACSWVHPFVLWVVLQLVCDAQLLPSVLGAPVLETTCHLLHHLRSTNKRMSCTSRLIITSPDLS